MATIDELFDTIDESLETSIDELLVIDPNTRQINLPGSELIFGVESDTQSERKYFICPRIVGNNVDLASCFIRVNYRNANGDIDAYLVNDATVVGDNIMFSWELRRTVTMYKGQTSFIVSACRPGASNVEWHTTLAIGLVLEGLEPDGEKIESETSDVVAQLVALVESQTDAVKAEGATQVSAVQNEGETVCEAIVATAEATKEATLAEIEAKGTNTLASIPDDYTALGEAVEAIGRKTAPGIVCEVEGESVYVSDASDNYIQNLRIFGKSTQDGVPSPDAPVEIVSVENLVVNVCGKNLFDGKLEIGTINANGGALYYLETESRTVNYIPVIPRVPIYIKREDTEGAIKPRFYDREFNYVGTGTGNLQLLSGYSEANPMNDGTAECCVSITNEAIAYMKICVASVNLENRYMVSFVNADYEKSVDDQTVSISHTLHGIPVTSGGNYTDSDGQQWICDEVNLERGVYVQRVAERTLDGSEQWVQTATANCVQARLAFIGYGKGGAGSRLSLLCDQFRPSFDHSVGSCYFDSDTFNCNPYATGSGTLDDWVNHLKENPMRIVYALLSPTETPLTEAEIAAYRALHTNKPNTTVLNDAGAHMVVEYVADTKLYIDNKIAALVNGN